MMAMLQELPKWVKMTDPDVTMRATVTAPQTEATVAATSTEKTFVDKVGEASRSAASLEIKQSSGVATAAQLPSVPPQRSPWDIAIFLAGIEESLKAAAAAAAAQPDKSPLKEQVRRSIFGIIPHLHIARRVKGASCAYFLCVHSLY